MPPVSALLMVNQPVATATDWLKVTVIGAFPATPVAAVTGVVAVTAGMSGAPAAVLSVTLRSSMRQLAVLAAGLPAPL